MFLLNRINYLDRQEWKKGDLIGPVIRSVGKGETDVTGSPLRLTHERLNLVKTIQDSTPFRYYNFFNLFLFILLF